MCSLAPTCIFVPCRIVGVFVFVRGPQQPLVRGFTSNAPMLLLLHRSAQGSKCRSEAGTRLKFSWGSGEETAELLRMKIPESPLILGCNDPDLVRAPFSIPSFSSTRQRSTELIFYHSQVPRQSPPGVRRPFGCNQGKRTPFFSSDFLLQQPV